jgi:hypothetical protein
MPKNTRNSGTRKNRRASQPNVFVQSTKTEDTDVDIQNDDSTAVESAAPRTRARVERTTRRASVRSEIYTRSLSGELKKMGALSGAIAVVLVVLTFAL